MLNKESVMAAAITTPTVIAKGVLLEDDAVRILDRRVFPIKTEFVDCRTYDEVAVAIEDMVTQSGGPFYAAGAGYVLAARQAQKIASAEQRKELLAKAGERLLRTRPTNNNIRDVIAQLSVEADKLIGEPDLAGRIEAIVRDAWARQASYNRSLGEHAASMVDDGDTILTHCWAESSIIEMLAAAMRAGKKVKVICTETRPYLQGARLTAHSVGEMGIDVTVITDNMATHAMDLGMVNKLMTAADRVTLSGHVINKVGTHQLALAAHNFGIPFVAMVRFPDAKAATPADVRMEERDGGESLNCLGMRTASPLAKGWYPAFDVTPPRFVSAVATSVGVFPAALLHERFSKSAA
jgi:methylthioribose-1-phosphate isomerase